MLLRSTSLRQPRLVPVLIFMLLSHSISVTYAETPVESPRLSPLVKVIQAIEPAVVAIFTPVNNQLMSGSGTVIHEDGYVLTNNHILPLTEGFALLPHSKPVRFRVVGRVPEADLAVIRLLDLPLPLKTVPIGRSEDLMNGESVVVAGNPGGRGTVFTSGIVSAKGVLEGGPNALVMTNYENSRRDRFIQFDAASNRGNSGGPLVNMDGELIGIVSANVLNEQNVGLAIPIDRVRIQFEQMIEPELMHQLDTGMKLDALAGSAVVQVIEPDSAATASGIEIGDEVVAVDGKKLRHAIDWVLALEMLMQEGKSLQLSVIRQSKNMTLSLTPRLRSPWESVDVPDRQPGLNYAFYHGNFNQLPDFSTLAPQANGVVAKLALKELSKDREDYFAITFEGLLEVAHDGLYRFVLISDDGSRLLLHGKTVIDHDGNHPPKPAGRLVRLAKGVHPLRVEYFQGNGEKTLQLFLERCDSRETISLKPLPEIRESDFFRAGSGE